MSKIIKCGADANDTIIKGIDAVADIVKSTIGPKGRNVLVRNQVSAPIITNDGVTIAKSIELKDNIEDAGAQLIIQAANRTNIVAGDGTSTTTVLAQELINTYMMNFRYNEKLNVVQVQKDMIAIGNEISDYLKSIAIPVKNNEDIKRVATISSGNENTGKLIADAFKNAGEYGSVIVEDSKTGMDNINIIQGMKLTNGMVTPYLFKDRVNSKSDTVDVSVLITKDKIDSVTDMFKVLDLCINAGKKLLVICDDIEFEPLNMILMNKAKGIPLDISIIRLPGFGELRESLVEDICIATGATLMGRDIGRTLSDFTCEFLGEAEQVTVTMDDTIIKFKDVSSNGMDLLSVRKERVDELKVQEDKSPDNEKEQYRRRISNLISGISVIEVGGNSEVEIQDKKLRIEDAINSVQSAKEEGIVPGGGYSFLMAYRKAIDENREVSIGERIVLDSLPIVTRQIAENAGFNGAEVVSECCNKQLGFDALTEQYVDLVDAGVINSVKVDRYSLINAISVASTVITMGGVIVEENEPDQNVFTLQAPKGLPPM